jgi:Ca2+-binding EF-hand superfamily protein
MYVCMCVCVYASELFANTIREFETLDANKDGTVSREEFLAGAKTAQQRDFRFGIFNAIDINCDGELSKAEIAIFVSHPEYAKAVEKQTFTDFKSEFDKLDVNKDGKIDKKEIR